jgi:hypothetical protein
VGSGTSSADSDVSLAFSLGAEMELLSARIGPWLPSRLEVGISAALESWLPAEAGSVFELPAVLVVWVTLDSWPEDSVAMLSEFELLAVLVVSVTVDSWLPAEVGALFELLAVLADSVTLDSWLDADDG